MTIFPPPGDIQPYATGALPVLLIFAALLERQPVVGYAWHGRFTTTFTSP